MESLVRVQPLDCDFSLEAPERNREWYEQRGYEPASTALFRTVATGADVVLDIGAHVGYFSLVGASAAPGATVVAVEASPENSEVLRRNVEGLGVRVVSAAFAAEAGNAVIQLTEASDNSGFSGHPNSPTERSAEVPAVTAGELELPGGQRLVVKLDVEGHELDALTGLETLLERFEDVRLLVEMNPKCLALAGSSADELVTRLRGYGLRLFVIDEDARSWRELSEGDDWRDLVDPTRYANLYCVRRARCRTVAAVLHSSGLGGAERSHSEMVESLVRQGCMVHTVMPDPDTGLRGELLRVGGSVSLVPPFAWWALWPHEAQVEPAAWTSRALVHVPLIQALGSVRPDVVLTQSGVIPQGAIAAAALRAPHIWYLREFGDLDHGLVLPDGFGDAVRTLSARVVTNSAAVRDHLVGDGENVSVVHPAPVLPGLQAPGAAAPAGRPWTLGIVASLNPGKGQVDAVEAIALLRAQGVDVPLVLHGPGTPADQVRLAARAEELGVADLVDLAGVSGSRAEMYGRLDAVAMTSRAEAFGRVPFEAVAAGLPVIYADAGGPAEYLSDGITGAAYVPGDAASLAAAIRRVREEPVTARALVQAAREALLGPESRQAFDDAVRRLVLEAAGSGPENALVDIVGSEAREALGNAEEAALWLVELESTRSDFARVLAEHTELVEHSRALAVEHATLVDGHLGVVAARTAEQSVHTATVAELEESRRANASMRAEVGDTREQLDRIRSEVAALREERDAARAAYERVVATRTWQLRERAVRALRRG